ncbi:MAG: lipopolysaccharide biosynthesis protein [Armatimonadota bacterium]
MTSPSDTLECAHAPQNSSGQSLRAVTVRGIGLFGITEVSTKLFSFAVGVALARILEPRHYGVVAAAGLLIELTSLFSSVGIGAAVVHRRDRIREALHTGFFIQTGLSLALFLLVFFTAPLWGAFYRRPDVTPVVRVLALGLIINSLTFAPSTMLSRELRFGLMCLPEVGSALGYAMLAVPLALAGAKHWSLVGGILGSAVLSLVVWYVVSPYRPRLMFDPALARELWGYGRHVLATTLVGYLVIHVDDFAVGRMLGVAALGYYAFAYRWGNWAATDLVRLVNRITFPAYAKIQHDLDRVREAYLESLRCLGAVVIPISFGLFAVAPQFIVGVFGAKWAPSIVPLELLAFFGTARAIGSIGGSVRQGIGRPDVTAKLSMGQLAMSAALLVPLIRAWGLFGAVMAVLAPALITNFAGLVANQMLFGARVSHVLKVLQWPFLASVGMAGAVRGVAVLTVAAGLPPLVHLTVGIGVGAAAYVGLMFALAPRDARNMLSTLRTALSRQA